MNTLTEAPVESTVDDADLSPEELRTKIRALRDLLHVKEGKPTRATVQNWFSLESDDFFGSGLTPAEFIAKGEVERYQRAFVTQHRKEQHRRIDFVVRLSTIYAGLQEAGVNYLMAFALNAIMDVIDGDWKDAQVLRSILLAETEPEKVQEYSRVLYSGFVKALDEAIATAPASGDDEATRH